MKIWKVPPFRSARKVPPTSDAGSRPPGLDAQGRPPFSDAGDCTPQSCGRCYPPKPTLKQRVLNFIEGMADAYDIEENEKD